MVKPPAGAVWGITDLDEDEDEDEGLWFGAAIVLRERRRRRWRRRHGEEGNKNTEQVRKEKAASHVFLYL